MNPQRGHPRPHHRQQHRHRRHRRPDHGGPAAQGLPLDEAFTVGFWACADVGVVAILGAIAAPSLLERREAALRPGIQDIDELAG